MSVCPRNGTTSRNEVGVGGRIFVTKKIQDKVFICGETKGKVVVPLLPTDEIITVLKEYLQGKFKNYIVAICDKEHKQITI
ncbi:MAG: hypothetical protein NTZ42_02165 [Candidatus Gribaldobacteria bacterium]|nr:hypothetical protein [Candidatus Gribaldobacteria bacterium]